MRSVNNTTHHPTVVITRSKIGVVGTVEVLNVLTRGKMLHDKCVSGGGGKGRTLRLQEMEKDECSFEWDNDSQLYFHASSGFYHDPSAGWYYSSKDGLYYKFENGNYVLLESEQGEENEAQQQTQVVTEEPIKEQPSGDIGCINCDEPNNPPPPSEWLEETLIDLYLAGYSQSAANAGDDLALTMEADVGESEIHQSVRTDDADEIEEGEIISKDLQDAAETSGRVSDEGTSWDEENWRAQYGQVIQSGEEVVPLSFRVVDLWDWAMVRETIKKKKHGRKKKYQVARLVGKLVKPSTKLHPSMPSGGTLFKTAAICEVHLALVRVSSGQVYQLRTPSMKYLTSLSTFDSSDPTKEWGFPMLSVDGQSFQSPNLDGSNGYETPDGVPICEDSSALLDQLRVSEKQKDHSYRDRAAERRALHGGFGVGPGQKKSGDVDVGEASSPASVSTEEAAAEALNMSFGAGSYARRLLENMGWKEGEALGNTSNGLIEPLQAVGNKGYAGLGWEQQRPNLR
ncbi:G-patch domain [Macleaya cordata]|uniref:G-patch domain n=1 Tax=Macleaya cordata TaxID=56857 RepID=A0A200RAZ5_MACCD|nr:G-patch domain [Macleaya cordata]